MSSPRTLAFRFVEDVFVLCHTASVPDDDEWQAHMDYLKEDLERTRRMRSLVITAGGAPTLMQRRGLEREMRMAGFVGLPTAVVTDAWAVRHVIRLIGWFNPAIRAFPGHGLDEAMAYLGADLGLWPAIRATVAELQGMLANTGN